jgi:leucyl-tRNA---protein transferase
MRSSGGHTQHLRLAAKLIDCGPCPYLPGKDFQALAVQLPEAGAGPVYRALLDRNFRRNGAVAYTPRCAGCTACRQLRLEVAHFQPRRDQRRCAQRNADLSVTVQQPGMDAERAELWRRWNAGRHGRDDADEPSEFTAPPGGMAGLELHARDAGGRLVAVSCCDVLGDALSSITCYHDPAQARRALGTFLVLAEIDHCRRVGLRWLYLGFHIAACGKMAYKARYVPHQRLGEDGRWQVFADPAAV